MENFTQFLNRNPTNKPFTKMIHYNFYTVTVNELLAILSTLYSLIFALASAKNNLIF